MPVASQVYYGTPCMLPDIIKLRAVTQIDNGRASVLFSTKNNFFEIL